MNSFSHSKKAISIIIILITIFGIWQYSQKRTTQNPITNEDVTISLKWVNQAQFAGIFVAKDLDFYKKTGLTVSIDEFKSGDSVMDDLKSGSSQFGLMSANEFLGYYADGEKIKAIAAFYQVSPYMVASLKNNPTTSPVELKGKRLGIKGGNGAEANAVYDLLLTSGGLDADDAEFIVLPLDSSEKEDLLEERVDVIGFYRTRLYQFDKDGLQYQALYPEQYGAALYNDVLVVTDDYLEEHEDAIANFVHATIDGWNYAYKNKEEAIAITLRYVTEDIYKDIDYERYILSQSESLMKPLGERGEVGMMKLKDWQRFHDTLYARKAFTKPFDVADSFTNRFLP